jgi:hypothetical protein
MSKEEHCAFCWLSALNINNAWKEKHKIDHLFRPMLDFKNLGSLCPLSIELYDLVVKKNWIGLLLFYGFATENCLSY